MKCDKIIAQLKRYTIVKLIYESFHQITGPRACLFWPEKEMLSPVALTALGGANGHMAASC